MKVWKLITILILAVLFLLQGCATSSMAKTSRFAFSPDLEKIIRENRRLKPGRPIAERYSYTWQHVYQDLTKGKPLKKGKLLTVVKTPSTGAMTTRARKLAANHSEQRRVHARLARTSKNRGDTRYHNEMARLNAEQALLQEKMAVAGGRIDAAIGMVNSVAGIYGSMAAMGRQMGDRNYGLLTDEIVRDMNLSGQGAPKGSRLHFEYHYGFEPSKGKNFSAGLVVMFGGNADSMNSAMLTAVLTLPNGKRITATRAIKMLWYTGEGNLKRRFPKGFREIKVQNIPIPKSFEGPMLHYQVLNQLAHAAANDIRKKMRRMKL